MDVYVVTAWNETTEEDFVAVFATQRLASAAWRKIEERAAESKDVIYGGWEKRRVIGT